MTTAADDASAELDAYLQKAKDAGITPIAQFNGGATGGLAFPLQNLMAAYGKPAPVNDWIFQKQGATIDTPDNLKAAAAPRPVDQGRLLRRRTSTRSTTRR